MFEAAVVRAGLLSLLPGLFWLIYLRSLSPRRCVSPWLWLWALALGWASTELTLWVSRVFQVNALLGAPVLPMLVYFILGVGLVEEGAKALCAFLGLSLPGWAKDPLLSLQLCGAVALGFATAENISYVLAFGEGVLVGRFVFSTLGHVLFSALWGFALATYDRDGERARRRWGVVLGSLVLSGVAHGLYNWFVSSDRMVMAVLTLAVLWFGFRQATLEAFLRQEYERELPYDCRECPVCTVLTRADGRYCTFCGGVFEPESTSSSPPDEG